jgi:hypothetical protein
MEGDQVPKEEQKGSNADNQDDGLGEQLDSTNGSIIIYQANNNNH